MKILFIQHASEMGGSLKSLYFTLMALQESPYNFKVSVLCRKKHIAKWYKDQGIDAYYFPFIGRLAHCTIMHGWYNYIKQILLMPIYVIAQYFLLRFHPYFKTFPIIHLNSSILISSGISAKLAKRKLIWHIREITHDGIRGEITRQIIEKLADKIICISPMERSRFSNTNVNISTIYNFVPDEMFIAPEMNILKNLEDQLGINKAAGDLVILHLGGHNPQKCGDLILKAMGHVNMPANVHLLWLGDDLLGSVGPNHTRLSKNIHNIGVVNNVKNYLYLSDVVYFGALVAHFPRPVFEGMCAKKPALSFKLPGMDQFVQDSGPNQDGLLVPCDNNEQIIEELVNSAKWMLKNRNELIQFGLNGYKNKGLPLFSKDRNISQVAQAYK